MCVPVFFFLSFFLFVFLVSSEGNEVCFGDIIHIGGNDDGSCFELTFLELLPLGKSRGQLEAQTTFGGFRVLRKRKRRRRRSDGC